MDWQKALGPKVTNVRLRREVLKQPDDALKMAKRGRKSAQKALAEFEERAGQVNARASGLHNWIKNPRRMMWLKLIEIRERDKILGEINAQALSVQKWKTHVAVRQEWLKSDEGTPIVLQSLSAHSNYSDSRAVASIVNVQPVWRPCCLKFKTLFMY